MCSLSGMACYQSTIKRIFKDEAINNQGKYTLSMYLNGENVDITIDDCFPCYAGTCKPAFAKPCGTEIWVMLIEKAWAKINRSYKNIINNSPGYPVRVLTGAPSECIFHNDTKSDDLWM